MLEDKNGTFYEIGSARLSNNGQKLLALLAGELKSLPNALLIEGHTDAAQYSDDADYGNWELSADRANAARRLLQQDGVRADQVTQVRGYADQMLRVKTNPYDPSNRRISILVKNDGAAPPALGQPQFVGSTSAADVDSPNRAAGPNTGPNGSQGSQARPATAIPPPKTGLVALVEAMLKRTKK